MFPRLFIAVGTIIIDVMGYQMAMVLVKIPDMAFAILGGALLTFCVATTVLSIVTLLTTGDL